MSDRKPEQASHAYEFVARRSRPSLATAGIYQPSECRSGVMAAHGSSLMNPRIQIGEIALKMCSVGLPRQLVQTRAASRLSAKNAPPSSPMLRWWSDVNFSFFLCLAACRTRSSAWVTRARPCARCVLCSLEFLLVPALGSIAVQRDWHKANPHAML